MSTDHADETTACPTLPDLLRWRATHQPERRAYTFLVDGEAKEAYMTYEELDRQARAVATLLQRRVTAGERALLLYQPGLEYIAAFFGCLYAGVIAVPVYPPNPARLERTLPRLRNIVLDACPAVVLTTTSIRSLASALASQDAAFAAMEWLTTDMITRDTALEWQIPRVHSETLAFLQYTSGSTATPRGVMVSHGNLLHNAAIIQQAFGLGEASIGLCWLPLYHDMGLIGNVLQALYTGGHCILMSPTDFLQKPARWLQAISRYGVTTSGGPNFAYDLCIRKITGEQRAGLDLRSWSVAFDGAEPVRADTLERFAAAFEPCGFRREALFPSYGLAEATLLVSGGPKGTPLLTLEVNRADMEHNRVVIAPPGSANTSILVSSGQIRPTQQVVIVDPDTRTQCAPDQVGEIWISGPSVAKGYWNQTEATEQTFGAYLADTGEGPFLRSGDLGFIQGGKIFITSRLKDLIIIRGRNHTPQDIEYTTEKSHPALRAGCGAAFTVDEAGEERLIIVYEVERQHRNVNIEEVAGAIRQAVAEDHELHVQAVVLLKTGSIPKTPSGKVQRYACRAGFLAGSLQEIASNYLEQPANEAAPLDDDARLTRVHLLEAETAQRYTMLATYLQRQLARTMGLSASLLAWNSPFTALGLDSLKALELKSCIETDLEIEVPLVLFIEQPTIEQLASALLSDFAPIAASETTSHGNRTAPSRAQLPPVENEISAPTRPADTALAATFGQAGRKEIAGGALQVTAWDTTRDERYTPFPLTDIQQAYWMGRNAAFELGGVSTHIYLEVDSRNLDVERLTRAWQQLIARHDMLRAIVLSDGQQQILKHVPAYQIDLLDLREQDQEMRTSQLVAIRERMSHQVLGADQWPLFEIRASQLDEERTRLHFSFDLLIADAWSFQLLSRELAQLYLEPTTSLPPLAFSFRDYILAEIQRRASAAYQRSLDYWRNRLTALPPAPDLPLAKNPASLEQLRFVRRSARLDMQMWQQLKTLAGEAGLTPASVLLAAFAEVLATWSKTSRFTINLTLFNRLPVHPQVNDIIGDFTSLTLLEVNSSASETFAERARRLQKQLWQDLNHRQVSGVRVLRQLARNQESRANAKMPVVFTSMLHQGDSIPIEWLGEQVYAISQTPQVWLDHQVSERAGALVFSWDAIEELFPAGLLDDMFDAYCHLLRGLACDEIWKETTRQLVPSAQLAVRVAINATSARLPHGLLHTLFEAQVTSHQHDLAVISAQRKLTYDELYQRSNRVGHWLRRQGVRPNTLVAVVMEKGWEQVVAVLGILAAGAAYLPIDPGLPRERRWYLLENGQVAVALTQPWLDKQLEWPENVVRLCIDDQPVSEGEGQPLQPIQRQEDLAYVIFTSGSSGQPKGVMIDHRGAVNTIADLNQRFNVGPADRVLALSNLNFDLSVYDIFGTLAAGGTIVMPEEAGRRDPAHWLDLLVREQVTIWNSVPTLMQMLVEYMGGRCLLLRQSSSNLPGQKAASLRLVMLSGDWIPVTLPEKIKALWAGTEVYSLGGATEASIWSILYPIQHVEADWKSIPYGRPMLNQTLHVLNDILEPCPVWVPGQLYIGGIGLAKGYWRDVEKTRAQFIQHPRTGERLYRTGDLGRYLPNGTIEFLGREDLQVKIHGHRIELGEIEDALLQHPAVHAAIVTTVGEPRGNRRLAAYIVPEQENGEQIADRSLSTDDPLWTTVIQAANHQAKQVPCGSNFVPAVMHRFDRLVTASVCRTLRKLGVYTRPYEAYTLDELMKSCRIIPRYQKWLLRSLNILVEDGLLQRDAGRFVNPEPLPTDGLASVWAEIEAKFSNAHTALIRAAHEHLEAVITGDVHAAQFLFPEGDSSQAERLYAENFHHCNLIAQAAIRAAVQAWPADKPLRVLEIGAGVGSTTEYVLPVLPADRTSYHYTDISRYFMHVGQKRFAAYSFVMYDLLDIEKHPQSQGLALHSFDIVIAASVLHATRNIAETLQHVCTLLSPGGLLLLVEETRFHRVFNLSMGLQQGFDRFADTALRQTHPLLSIEQWQTVLHDHGFTGFAACRRDDSDAAFLGLDVLLARHTTSAVTLNAAELGHFLRQKLPDYMLPSAFLFLDRFPLTENGKVDRRALPAPEEITVQPDRAYAPPTSELERMLVTIWQEVLDLKQVSIQDNFFDLGGDSLLITQMLSKLRERLHGEIAITDLFQYPTISALAEHLSQRGGDAGHPLQPKQSRADNRRNLLARRGQLRQEQRARKERRNIR